MSQNTRSAGGKKVGDKSRKKARNGQLRRNVGLVVIDGNGRVLAGLRSHANGDKAWQLPQGGIEGRERPLTAAYRELREETGVVGSEVELIMELPNWTVYKLPKAWMRGRRFIGQRQKWYLFKYLPEGTPDVSKAKDKEFEALDWVDPEWLVEHVIEFRKAVYRTVFDGFAGKL